MTAAELIDLLRTFPSDAPVAAHGCDCANGIAGARLTGGAVNLLTLGDDLDTSYDLTAERLARKAYEMTREEELGWRKYRMDTERVSPKRSTRSL